MDDFLAVIVEIIHFDLIDPRRDFDVVPSAFHIVEKRRRRFGQIRDGHSHLRIGSEFRVLPLYKFRIIQHS